jgi:hypothetical protein
MKTISHIVVAVVGLIAGFMVGVYSAEPWWYPEIVHSIHVRTSHVIKEYEKEADLQKTRADVADSWARRLSEELEQLKAKVPQ